jgi:uncharacterized protein (UPF0333 family)
MNIHLHKKQSGFAHLELLLIVLVIVAVGGAGYYVYNKSKKSDKSNTTSTQEDSVKTASVSWQKGGIAVEGKYADADIVSVDSKTWRLYYAVQPEVQGNNFEVYSSTSTDGITWKQEPGTRKTMATFPEVIKLKDGRYRMYYQSASVIKSAISTDGLSFSDESGTRIDKANPDNLEFDNVAAPTIIQQDDGTFIMVYRGTINERYAENTPNPTTQLLLWATSTDGLSFTKKGLAIDSRSESLDGQLDGPDIVKWDDGKYHVFMTSYTGVYESMLDSNKFSTPNLAYAGEAKQTSMGFMGAPPGDPTTAKINGTWYMYYGATGSGSGIYYATLK